MNNLEIDNDGNALVTDDSGSAWSLAPAQLVRQQDEFELKAADRNKIDAIAADLAAAPE